MIDAGVDVYRELDREFDADARIVGHIPSYGEGGGARADDRKVFRSAIS